jgi:hypothetical protein
MHVVGIKQEIVDRHPWVATNLYKAFEQSKAVAMERMENPRIVPLAWYREGWEEQERILGKDPGNTDWRSAMPRISSGSSPIRTSRADQAAASARSAVPQCLRGPQARRIQDLALVGTCSDWPRNIEEIHETSWRRVLCSCRRLHSRGSGMGGRMAVAACSHRQYLRARRCRRHPGPHRRRPSLQRIQAAVLR